MVIGAVFGLIRPLFARRVFEEEDDTVNLSSLAELIGLESYEFFELNIFDAELLNEVCEDALRGVLDTEDSRHHTEI